MCVCLLQVSLHRLLRVSPWGFNALMTHDSRLGWFFKWMEYFSLALQRIDPWAKNPLSSPGFAILATRWYGSSNPMNRGVPVAFRNIHTSQFGARLQQINKMKKDFYKGSWKKSTIHHLLFPRSQKRRGWDRLIKRHIMEWRGDVKEICELWGLYKSRFLHQADESNKHYHLQKNIRNTPMSPKKKKNPLPNFRQNVVSASLLFDF